MLVAKVGTMGGGVLLLSLLMLLSLLLLSLLLLLVSLVLLSSFINMVILWFFDGTRVHHLYSRLQCM